MKIDMENGPPTIDAEDLAELLELPADQVQPLMHAGKITSRFETGVGEDAGKLRLTFFYAGNRLRLTCGEDGTVRRVSRIKTGKP